MRIHVTGNAGAGKTTLARKLGDRLGASIIHLDRMVWRAGWKQVPTVDREKLLIEASEPDSWLIEGVSRLVRQRADIVVFLDVPRHVCLWRCLKRSWRYLFRSRPELPPNCPEYLILPKLVRIIWEFPSLVGDRIRAEAAQSGKYIVFRSQAEIDHRFSKLSTLRSPKVRRGRPYPFFERTREG